MSVQLIITGEHATDLAAELKMLAQALFPTDTYTGSLTGDANGTISDDNINEVLNTPSKMSITIPEGQSVTVAPFTPEKPKRAPRAKKYAPVDLVQEKIAAMGGKLEGGEIVVDDPLAVEEPAPKSAENEVIDGDAIRAIIEKVGKNPNGETDPEKYAKIYAIMKGAVTAGTVVKIANIPADKLKEVYYGIAVV